MLTGKAAALSFKEGGTMYTLIVYDSSLEYLVVEEEYFSEKAAINAALSYHAYVYSGDNRVY